MAWSDAAREAAAQARKAHAQARAQPALPAQELRDQTRYNKGAGAPHYRHELASQVKAVRAGKAAREEVITSRGVEYDKKSPTEVMQAARQSTQVRNYYRNNVQFPRFQPHRAAAAAATAHTQAFHGDKGGKK